MRPLALVLALFAAACHTASMRDHAAEAASVAAPPPAQERAELPFAPPQRPLRRETLAASDWTPSARPLPALPPVRKVDVPVSEDRVASLRGRVEALERKVASLERTPRPAANPPRGPEAPALSSTRTLVALGLLTLLAVAAAIVAIAHAHRARLELRRAREA